MSNLPFLTATRVEIPKRTQVTTRGLASQTGKRGITATMPRGAKPAAVSASADFMQIPRQQRVSLENKLDDIFRGIPFSTVEFETIPGLIVCLKERKRKAVLNGDYETSQKSENYIVRLNNMLVQRKFSSIKAMKMSELDQQLKTAQAQLKAIMDKWNKKVDQFNDQQSRAADELRRKNECKLAEFNGDIPSELPANHRKLSAPLLDMREQERQLVLTKRYSEATALKRVCDAREKTETEQQKSKFMDLVKGRRQKILQEQDHAIECFTLRWTRQSERITAERDDEIRTQQKIIDNIVLKMHETESEEVVAK